MKQLSESERALAEDQMDRYAARDPVVILLDKFYPDPRQSNTLTRRHDGVFDMINWDTKEVRIWRQKSANMSLDSELVSLFQVMPPWYTLKRKLLVAASESPYDLILNSRVVPDVEFPNLVIPAREASRLLSLMEVKYEGAEAQASKLFKRSEKLSAIIQKAIRD